LKPENIILHVEINSTYLGDWSSLKFENGTEVINMYSICSPDKNSHIQRTISGFFRETFWIKLLETLNINYWVLLIAGHQ